MAPELQPDFSIRPAVMCDLTAIRALHADALRHLSCDYYDERQIDAALRGIGTIDPALISAGTYFVAADGDGLIGSGGWSPAGQLLGCGQPNGNDIGAGSTAAARASRGRSWRTRNGGRGKPATECSN